MLLLSIVLSIAMVISLAFCLCWRKKTPKNEWLGLDGMVTQKNPDENVNHLPSVNSTASNTNDDVFSNDSVDSSKRNTTNTRRSLPDIPSEQSAGVNWEPTGDNSSEHYATVGQYQNSHKTRSLTNGIEARPSISQHSSISQADDSFSPYERVKYDKIKAKEHPYAQVQPTTSRQVLHEENHVNANDERSTLLRVDISCAPNEPVAPTRSRRSSGHSGHGLDIPAASAVAGGIAASPDLPYMTPPIVQSNFSGDSQDSSKGYTSISVREPLANILAQTKQQARSGIRKRDLDPHYSTVSDDSDDVYTTIPDPNNAIYTSESETYARIPAMPIQVEAEINPVSCSSENEQVYGTVQPTPPSVDSLKQVTGHCHSRQASSSSSIANVGSPKPEKRQANSPLPPPPTGPSSNTASHASLFDFHVDKAQQPRNLDDLYAKVHKSKKEEPVFEKKQEVEVVSREHNYETLKKSAKHYDPGYERVDSNEEPGYASINGPDSITSSDPGYEVLKQTTVVSSSSDSDPNYEQLKDLTNDGYSIVNKGKKKKARDVELQEEKIVEEPNYESMPSGSYGGVKSTDSESDPNYESVRDLMEPPYERLDDDSSSRTTVSGEKHLTANSTISSDSSSGASKSDRTEPPYEQLSNDTDYDVAGYEKVSKTSKSDEIKVSTTNSDDESIFQV